MFPHQARFGGRPAINWDSDQAKGLVSWLHPTFWGQAYGFNSSINETQTLWDPVLNFPWNPRHDLMATTFEDGAMFEMNLGSESDFDSFDSLVGTPVPLQFTGVVSVSAIIRLTVLPDATNFFRTIYGGSVQYTAGNWPFALGMHYNGGSPVLRVGRNISNTWTAADYAFSTLNQNFHVLGGYTGTRWELYVNGKLVGNSANTANGSNGCGTMPRWGGIWIEDFAGAGAYWRGYLGDLRMYKRPPTEDLANAIYSQVTRDELLAPFEPTIWWIEVPTSTSDDLTANSIATGAPVLGTPGLGQTHEIISSGIATGAPVIGTSTLGQTHGLTGTGITTGSPVLGTSTLGQIHTLTSSNLSTSAPVLQTPALGQNQVLDAVGIVTDPPAVAIPTLNQTQVLVATGLATGSPALGSPTISSGATHDLVATGIATGSPVVGTPIVSQTHQLGAVSLTTGSPVNGASTIGQTHNIISSGLIVGAPIVGNPSMSGTNALTVDSIVTRAPVLGNPVLGEVYQLGAVGLITGAPSLGSPTLAQVHALVSADLIAGIPILSLPEIQQVHILVSSSIIIGIPVLGTPFLSLTEILPPAERIISVRSESRSSSVLAEDRTTQVF